MKHLKLYEDNADLLGDIQGLDLSKKLYGWWVTVLIHLSIEYYVIYDTSQERAMISLMEELGIVTGNRDDGDDDGDKRIIEDITGCESFSDLSYVIQDWDRDTDTDIKAWEMTPTSKDIRDIKCDQVANPYNIPHAYMIGRKYFSDFNKKMERFPEGNEE